MADIVSGNDFRAGFFATIPLADAAIRNLLAGGFTEDQMAVICPERHRDHFPPGISKAERPGTNAAPAIVGGSLAGATLGGLALAATAIATGGVGLIPAIPVLLGGGAFAGGLSSLFVSDGYGEETREYYQRAVQQGKIVVGVELKGDDNRPKLAQVEAILLKSGADPVLPKSSTTTAAR